VRVSDELRGDRTVHCGMMMAADTENAGLVFRWTPTAMHMTRPVGVPGHEPDEQENVRGRAPDARVEVVPGEVTVGESVVASGHVGEPVPERHADSGERVYKHGYRGYYVARPAVDSGRQTEQGKGATFMASSTTVAGFHAHVAREISAFLRARSAELSETARYIADAGITAEVTPGTGAEYMLTVSTDDTAGLPDDTQRSDFTTEALAAYDAKYLAAEKERIYQWIKRHAQNGYIDRDQATAALESLGYTTAPVTETVVSARTWNVVSTDHYDSPSYEMVNFTLPGEHTAEEIQETLESILPDQPGVALVKGAFPDATGLPTPLRSLNTSVRHTWPAHSEFHTAG
jgi:hypothetical protein